MRFMFVEAVPAANMAWPRNVGTDALRAARRLGLTSVVATANRAAYGTTLHGLVDSWVDCDTTSASAVALAAQAAGADRVFSWIDAFVPVANAAAGLLGLPGANAGSPAVVRDKSVVRRQLDASGVRNARWAVIDLRDDITDSPIGYPAVIKPVDGTGGKDVMLVTDRASFHAACAAHLSRAGYGHQVVPAYKMVCEELLVGDLVSVEGIVLDGAPEIWGYSDRGHTGPPAYVETSFAFAASPFHPALEEYARQVAKALDYRTGCFHLEAIIAPDGPVLVEFNPRIASGIYRCVDLATGGSCLEAMLGAQLGSRLTLPAPSGAACRIYLEAPGSGTLRGVLGIDEARALPGVADVLVKTSASLAPGDADRRVAYVQATGATRAESRARAATAIAALTPVLELSLAEGKHHAAVAAGYAGDAVTLAAGGRVTAGSAGSARAAAGRAGLRDRGGRGPAGSARAAGSAGAAEPDRRGAAAAAGGAAEYPGRAAQAGADADRAALAADAADRGRCRRLQAETAGAAECPQRHRDGGGPEG